MKEEPSHEAVAGRESGQSQILLLLGEATASLYSLEKDPLKGEKHDLGEERDARAMSF